MAGPHMLSRDSLILSVIQRFRTVTGGKSNRAARIFQTPTEWDGEVFQIALRIHVCGFGGMSTVFVARASMG